MTASTETDTTALLSQFAGDPRAAQLAQLMTALNGGDRATDNADIKRQYKKTLERFKSIVKDFKRENRRLREVNNGLLAHSELLAGAVGACPECWGEDRACEFCEGDGGPGAFFPENESFEEFVKPVLRMVRENMSRKRQKQNTETTMTSTTQPPAEYEEQKP